GRRYADSMPHFICPNCKERSIDIDRKEGLFDEAVACHNCGFGFLFELLDDYYPAPTTGLVTCDRDGRVLAVGRGVFELSGWSEADVLGEDVVSAFGLAGFDEERNPVRLALEWGVRRLNEELELRTRAGQVKRVTGDFFPAYDDDGGLLVALTPKLA
ncbi:MAG TPA: PAS domain-containing protein, partial [Gaiellaceae bacterium]|nr:PAS domain-containing protein [Gaiellaceae bacterium]